MVDSPRPVQGLAARDLLALCRVSNLPTVWMNVLTALVLSSAGLSAGTLLLLALSLSAFYCGGMALNDLLDRHHDAEHQPFRPIPAGRVSIVAARGCALVLFGLGLGLLLLAPHPSAVLPGAGLLAVIYLYDRFHKQHPASVLLMAGCRTLTFVVAGWAVTGTAEPWVLLAGAIQFLYTLGLTVVARVEATREGGFGFPLIPRLIAGMAVVDGVVLALLVGPAWLAIGVAAALLTHLGQRFVRGD